MPYVGELLIKVNIKAGIWPNFGDQLPTHITHYFDS